MTGFRRVLLGTLVLLASTSGTALSLEGPAEPSAKGFSTLRGDLQSRWMLRVVGVVSRYEGGLRYQCGHTCFAEVDIDDVEAAIGLRVQYRFLRRFSLELSTDHFAEPRFDLDVVDFGFGTESSGNLEVSPLLLGLSLHLTAGKSFDLYAGPLFGRVSLDYQGRGLFQPSDDKNAIGLQIGGDWQFGQRLVLHASLRYLDVLVRFNPSFDLETMSLSAGLGYRF